jgi:hypothetical protein
VNASHRIGRTESEGSLRWKARQAELRAERLARTTAADANGVGSDAGIQTTPSQEDS